jgi:hypothetical protein
MGSVPVQILVNPSMISVITPTYTTLNACPFGGEQNYPRAGSMLGRPNPPAWKVE